MAGAYHQAAAVLDEALGQLGEVGVKLRLEGRRPAPVGPPSSTIVSSARAHLRPALVGSHYSQHWHFFLAGLQPPASSRLVNKEGASRLRAGGRPTS